MSRRDTTPASPEALLIDIGNSRLKWCIRGGRQSGRQHALALDGPGLPELGPLLRSARRVTSVVIVSVAGQARDRAITRALRKAGLPTPQFIQSSARAAGVTNGYRDPWRLGADRWVAAIGAWHEAGAARPVCVIDIGTATTLDVVDARGVHQGGLIVPGPALMTGSLLAGTRGIATRARGGAQRRTAGLARDTAKAIHNGALQATAGLVERCARDARRAYGRRTVVYLTGGGAASILPLLELRVVHCPDLVLRGLAVMTA
jgi:type III pantothenate kinase